MFLPTGSLLCQGSEQCSGLPLIAMETENTLVWKQPKMEKIKEYKDYERGITA